VAGEPFHGHHHRLLHLRAHDDPDLLGRLRRLSPVSAFAAASFFSSAIAFYLLAAGAPRPASA
jgi:hypothetical protein